MDKKIIARELTSNTHCELMEDGVWKVIQENHDRALYEGETEWLDEKIDAMVMDNDCQAAIQAAMNSTLSYLLQNVYNNGFSGLIEFREYERRLNASKAESTKDS